MKDAIRSIVDEGPARRRPHKMFVAYLPHLRPMGQGHSDGGGDRPRIGVRLVARIIILAEPAMSGVSCNRDVLELAAPADDIAQADLTPIIRNGRGFTAATEDVHDAARFAREVTAGTNFHTLGIDVDRCSISAQILRPK